MTQNRGVSTRSAALPVSEQTLMSATQIRAELGGITDVGLWRWIKRGAFPKHDIVVLGRRYWRAGTYHRWLAAQQDGPVSRPPQMSPREIEARKAEVAV